MTPHSPAPATRPHWSQAERFYAERGIPAPAPLTDEEYADLERRQDEADAAVERLYGLGPAAAA